MAATELIKQGESLPFCFDRDGEDVDGFVCTIFVKMFPDGTTFITRVIEAVGNTWPGFLTSGETAGLDVSSKTPYYLIGEIANTTTGEESQEPIRFHVAETWT